MSLYVPLRKRTQPPVDLAKFHREPLTANVSAHVLTSISVTECEIVLSTLNSSLTRTSPQTPT